MTHTTQSRAEMIAYLQGQAADAMLAVAEAQHQVAVIFGEILTVIVDIFNRTTNMEDRLQDESEARQADQRELHAMIVDVKALKKALAYTNSYIAQDLARDEAKIDDIAIRLYLLEQNEAAVDERFDQNQAAFYRYERLDENQAEMWEYKVQNERKIAKLEEELARLKRRRPLNAVVPNEGPN
jgi:chromosome segregation ATPase